MVAEGELLWKPSKEFIARSNLHHYTEWLKTERGLDFKGEYEPLRKWSVTELEKFWETIWDYFDVQSGTPYKQVLDKRVMPGAKWFEGSTVNYAEHLLRYETKAKPDEVAFHHISETRPLGKLLWSELGDQVRTMATQLRALGLKPGDRVVSYMPNLPETAVAMIATMAIGAIWSSAAPEFGVKTVTERFAQIEPKLIFAADGYRFGGKDFDRRGDIKQITDALPTLEHVIFLPYLNADAKLEGIKNVTTYAKLMDAKAPSREAFKFERVAHDHPIWILFSSGTTGLPKAIVHSHVGVLTEHLKLMHFQLDENRISNMFFYSTTGWMMFNLLVAALLTGSAATLYDGNPAYPEPDFLWKLAADTKATMFGASPTFVQIMEKMGLEPGKKFDLSALECVMAAGAPSTPETFAWFYKGVKKDLWVTSQSGGTEICSGFVGAAPSLPVHAGEIQTRMLGMDVRSWSDDGKEIVDEVGELVVTNPFPSMPVKFWNDAEGKRYHESYFDVFPGVWRHGDFLKINSRGGCYIYGRSDSTLNRFGVRIGTAEIYRSVEQQPEVADSLIVCCELPGGNFYMPLFVKLKPGFEMSDDVVKGINGRLRKDYSPRHVPDKIYAVNEVPYTLTGKKMEVPVRKILMGVTPEKAASRDAMTNPAALDYFIDFANTSTDYQWRADK